jgi:D-glycerate 3-kinase
MNKNNQNSSTLDDFLRQHQLDSTFIRIARKWFDPLAEKLSKQANTHKPYFVGINGSQGSGKSTLAAYLCAVLGEHFSLRTTCLSLDDFYLDQSSRERLAEQVHPLLATRGVPGTHNISQAINTLNALRSRTGTITVPTFNKATDNPNPDGRQIALPQDIIIVEGWCMGAEPQAQSTLETPVNELEKHADQQGIWRQYVNDQLANQYGDFFALIDYWIMLKAPAFHCVKQWRLEQENKLRNTINNDNSKNKSLASNLHTMNETEISDFIQHYQRLTEHMLDNFPPKAGYVYELDEHRNILRSRHN